MKMKRYLWTGLSFLLLGACATSPKQAVSKPEKKYACQNQPQWFSNDAEGIPSAAIFVCFGEGHELLWQSRPLSAEEIAKMTASTAKAKLSDQRDLGQMQTRLESVKRKAERQRAGAGAKQSSKGTAR